ncbi:MAG: 50S ribosomal protein L11 methyltransferase, partial [Desulfofustis sp.]
GMAFGTGHHETTRLCLELLQEAGAQVFDAEVLDVGTGTGILGMAALLFGASHVLGVDNDPEAVRAAAENIRLNNLSGRMEAAGKDIKVLDTGFDIVMANIVHDVLLEISDDLARLTKDGGLLILSGLLAGEQVQNLVHCFEQKSFTVMKKRKDGPWAALLFQKPITAAA